VQGKPVQKKETIYYVGTNDYLSNGGTIWTSLKRVQKFDYNTSCEIY
jgi:hypothetical protein